ncbi:Vomeronasal type-2 receptor 26 [Varanus komodoensis]|nr:Vomeronasal type-2 receptor 26 [Varanus komodoensis]
MDRVECLVCSGGHQPLLVIHVGTNDVASVGELGVVFLGLLPQKGRNVDAEKCNHEPQPPLHEYPQLGDIMIGAIASLSFIIPDALTLTGEPPLALLDELVAVPKNYQHILALAFAVQEINENPHILPNLTLGFHICDSYFTAKWTYQATLRLMGTAGRLVPNYQCGIQQHLTAVIGGLDAQTSLHVATLLDIYKNPQRETSGGGASEARRLESASGGQSRWLKGRRPKGFSQRAVAAVWGGRAGGTKAGVEKCKNHEPHPPLHEYAQLDDLMIGAIASLSFIVPDALTLTGEPPQALLDELAVVPRNYQHILALAFAVQEINDNPHILPNLTLGFRVYDSYFTAKWTYQATLRLICASGRLVHNYQCGIQQHLTAVIGGLDAQTSLHIATLLDIYKIPQLIYGSAPVMNDKTPGLSFYNMTPRESLQYAGILSLLQHFGWTWIGTVVVDNDNGERFLQMVVPLFSENGVCFAFIKKIPELAHISDLKDIFEKGAKMHDTIEDSTANVLVANGESYSMAFFRWLPYLSEREQVTNTPIGKVMIATAQVELTSFVYQRNWNTDFFHGALSFRIQSNDVPGFQQFLHAKKPSNPKGDGFIQSFWQQAFGCVFPDQFLGNLDGNICTGDEKLEFLPRPFFEMHLTGHSYNVYNAVHAVAHALHAMSSLGVKDRGMVTRGGPIFQSQVQWQLHHFLKLVSFNNSAGDKVSFNENGELVTGFDVINWIVSSNQSFRRVKVGRMDAKAAPDHAFTISPDSITWNSWFNQVPMEYRSLQQWIFLTPLDTSANLDYCHSCEEAKYPSKHQNYCIPKSVNFFSYEEPLGIILTGFAILFCLITTLVLGIFLMHHETPIIKANNRHLTYSFLTSLLLCFLCTLLFIGQPHRLTCLIRQAAFGIIFSLAVSCVLTKTVMVVLAFRATKPGSKIRKWMGKGLASTLLLFCCLIQAGICIAWLTTASPFPDIDLHSVAEEIILECNEGSLTMFYCVLGYLGFLASVSFVVAFLARKLPDSFNEAKFITFSMLIFWSVWLSFVPSYLSTKGKYLNYQHILALTFAVQEINDNPDILLNLTLGFHIYDSYFTAKWTYQATLRLICAAGRLVPNYQCGILQDLRAVIGGLDAQTSLHVANLLDIYKIPQLIYGSAPVLNDKSPGLSFYNMTPRESLQYAGILSLLLHFGWTWIGTVIMDNDNGERFLQMVVPLFSESGVCFAFIDKIKELALGSDLKDIFEKGAKIRDNIIDSTANVLVANGESYSMAFFRWLPYLSEREQVTNTPIGKVIIVTSQVELTSFVYQRNWNTDFFHGALSFRIQSNDVPGFQHFLNAKKPSNPKGDGFIWSFWQQAFSCVFPDQFLGNLDRNICTGDEKLECLPGSFFEMSLTGHSYNVYNAVHAVAHALHAMSLSGLNNRGMVTRGSLTFQSHLQWQRKSQLQAQTSQGSDLTMTLSQTQIPHPQITLFLLHRENQVQQPLGIILTGFALLFCLITALTLGIFLKHHETPIVKANNRHLTYTLLTSLLLCFLCALLFIGQPQRVTCLLRQAAFGIIIISVAVSCVLTKTVMVVLAFRATKPGSKLRKWMGKGLTSTLLVFCCLIQTGICIVWLATASPFPDIDLYSVAEEIILECNEGSIVMFYCVLGYLGFLASVSFMVAFLARKLPDSFNEAKFITFSMLVFCSVWLSFIPSYLSTKGKYLMWKRKIDSLIYWGGMDSPPLPPASLHRCYC